MLKWQNKKTSQLIRTLLMLKNEKEAKCFLRDLLTEAEIIEFGNRWQAVQMLDRKISYTKIVKQTGLSSRTIARISKWLNNGMNGYRLVLDRLNKKNHHQTLLSVQKR
ncbi:MAG: YerC/YecD family TrpR-related protein [Patescibacteria group bacterium]|jgi:TrpR-related protein YerC/YecD